MIMTSCRQLQLTARAYYRVPKLSRTTVDLPGEEINHTHLAEELQYLLKLGLMQVCLLFLWSS
jgi:predicted ATPase with chaperone activity